MIYGTFGKQLSRFFHSLIPHRRGKTTMSQQMPPTHIDEEKRKQEKEKLDRRMHEIGYKILVLSGKGGVGKSTVAANLAAAFVNQGKNVGLLDVDIHGPSIPTLFGLTTNKLEIEGNEIIPANVSDFLKVVSIGFLLEKNTDAVVWRGPRKFNMIRQFLTDVRWGSLDYLVIDSPPGTGDEPLSVAQLVGSPAGAVIVTTPQDVAIHDVRRCITFCQMVSVPVLGIVENMSGFICPNCGTKIDLFKSGGGQILAKEMNVPFLGRIPIEPQIVQTGDAGISFVNQYENHTVSYHFQQIVQQIITAHDNRRISESVEV